MPGPRPRRARADHLGEQPGNRVGAVVGFGDQITEKQKVVDLPVEPVQANRGARRGQPARVGLGSIAKGVALGRDDHGGRQSRGLGEQWGCQRLGRVLPGEVVPDPGGELVRGGEVAARELRFGGVAAAKIDRREEQQLARDVDQRVIARHDAVRRREVTARAVTADTDRRRPRGEPSQPPGRGLHIVEGGGERMLRSQAVVDGHHRTADPRRKPPAQGVGRAQIPRAPSPRHASTARAGLREARAGGIPGNAPSHVRLSLPRPRQTPPGRQLRTARPCVLPPHEPR